MTRLQKIALEAEQSYQAAKTSAEMASRLQDRELTQLENLRIKAIDARMESNKEIWASMSEDDACRLLQAVGQMKDYVKCNMSKYAPNHVPIATLLTFSRLVLGEEKP